ncbi:MAG TPA: hypothetical protein VFW78_06295 [Bacteroidia bacterium]|nr:hypothetical protein [Bacteroidia bacterium]
MKKLLRKSTEKEIHSVIEKLLQSKDAKAAKTIAKNIGEASRSLAKKFVKHLPSAPVVKKAPPAAKKKAASKSAKKAKKAVEAKTKNAAPKANGASKPASKATAPVIKLAPKNTPVKK